MDNIPIDSDMGKPFTDGPSDTTINGIFLDMASKIQNMLD